MRISAGLGAVIVTVAAFGSTPALAQLDSSLFSPSLGGDLVAPTYFDGLYGGLLYGNAGADHRNFYPTGGIDRTGVGVAVGWNTYLAPGVVAGVEAQGYVDTDFLGAWSLSGHALARLGLTTADNFLVYAVGGGGVFDLVPAYVFGAGWEWGVYDNISFRYEMLSIIQAADAPSGAYRPGITAWMIRLGALWHFGDGARDISGLHVSFDRPDYVTDFDGLYYGAYYGVHFNPQTNFFPDVGFLAHMSRADIGGIVGYNFHLLDGFVVAGVEAQGGVLFDTSGDVGVNALALAKLGVVPMEGLYVYGAGGLGMIQDKLAYAAGGGIEYALWGDASVRAEALALGEASATPVVAGFSSIKLSLGAIWRPE